jgi:hypothetical protein
MTNYSTEPPSKFKVTKCEWLCNCIHTISLQVFNIIDFILGLALITFAIFLQSKLGTEYSNIDTEWFAYGILGLGILLLLTTLFSFCSIVNSSCRFCASPASYLSFFIALLSATMATFALWKKSNIYDYLDDHYKEIGLDSNDVDTIKTYYIYTAYALYGLCIIELLRSRASSNLREQQLRIDGEYDNLLNENDKQWANTLESNKIDRKEKYENLKNHYKTKYDRNKSDDNV